MKSILLIILISLCLSGCTEIIAAGLNGYADGRYGQSTSRKKCQAGWQSYSYGNRIYNCHVDSYCNVWCQ